jgi:hypothetical protein
VAFGISRNIPLTMQETAPAMALQHLGLVLLAGLLLLPSPVTLGRSSDVEPRWSGARAVSISSVETNTTEVRWVVNSTPLPTVSFSFGLTANLTMPTGAVDPGYSLQGIIELATSGEAVLAFHAAGVGTSYAVPALGASGSVAIPGANYSYLGVPLQLYASTNASITANCVSVPTSVGCGGELSWNSSGGRSITVRPPVNASAGTPVGIDLRNLSLSFAIDLTARGTVPYLGVVSVPLPSGVAIPPIPGTPENVSSSVTVAALPRVVSVTADPQPARTGETTNLIITAVGGVPPLTYSYLHLPAGCNGSNDSTAICIVTTAGAYPINVTATDRDGASSEGGFVLEVGTPSSHSSGSSGGVSGAFGPTLTWVVLAAAGGAVVSGAGVWLWTRRASRK